MFSNREIFHLMEAEAASQGLNLIELMDLAGITRQSQLQWEHGVAVPTEKMRLKIKRKALDLQGEVSPRRAKRSASKTPKI